MTRACAHELQPINQSACGITSCCGNSLNVLLGEFCSLGNPIMRLFCRLLLATWTVKFAKDSLVKEIVISFVQFQLRRLFLGSEIRFEQEVALNFVSPSSVTFRLEIIPDRCQQNCNGGKALLPTTEGRSVAAPIRTTDPRKYSLSPSAIAVPKSLNNCVTFLSVQA